jgi:hypothetical protein
LEAKRATEFARLAEVVVLANARAREHQQAREATVRARSMMICGSVNKIGIVID